MVCKVKLFNEVRFLEKFLMIWIKCNVINARYILQNIEHVITGTNKSMACNKLQKVCNSIPKTVIISFIKSCKPTKN